jgi:hypothetical protein
LSRPETLEKEGGVHLDLVAKFQIAQCNSSEFERTLESMAELWENAPFLALAATLPLLANSHPQTIKQSLIV